MGLSDSADTEKMFFFSLLLILCDMLEANTFIDLVISDATVLV